MTTLPTHRRPLRLGPRGRWWFDVTLATCLLLPALATPAVDAGWVGLAVSLVQLVPLYWRRHHAVAVFAVVAAGSALQAVLLDTPLWSQVAFPVAVYSVARYASVAAGLAAMAVGLCGAVVAAVRWVLGFGDPLEPDPVVAYTVTIATIVVSAWALGALARTRVAYVDALVERGERIEREAAQQVALAASDERARIAREMHDVVAHGLSTIVVQADGARYAAGQDPAVATAALETIATTGRDSLTEMRRMLGLLRTGDSSELRPQPGLADLAGLIVGDDVDATLPDPATPVPDGVGLTAYRIVQEALTNVRKHAGPDVRVRVVVSVGDEVTVLVEDDGRGAAADDDGHGLGLVGMRERVAAHGGTLEARPRPGGGFRVAARLPL
ncbi:sensor histidine kinase [Nocardioides sp. MAH-18]|uniref:Oxygen sensor histidine kinase NreB n=1 Tax=Nocardioides agri TaxID=2682843 RepID=A0A6L6XSA6_9ACTN|nr:sensor histidine kinase [Nocardioides sp. CGMCC 1.13656]MBA2955383.1 sensor histidine kinase [Nocardioides sp. CGMCC 1.13656]MVQ50234.1 sensor histidine kinase [Nocardioides sp. MAH-18]